MINVKKMIRKEQGLCLIVTELDAKAANIITEDQKNSTDISLVLRLEKLSNKVDSDTLAKQLKEYLIESVFNHYVDMVAVLDYIYTMRKSMRSAMEHVSHSKFIFVTEFINIRPTDSDDDGYKKDKDKDEKGDPEKGDCEKDK